MCKKKKDAYQDVLDMLGPNEAIEAVVFGDWGWAGYNEPEPAPVPKDRCGQVLMPDEAKGYMHGWSFDGGFGSPNCYAAYIWTNKRVIFVSEYDGSTRLNSVSRIPMGGLPTMPGGG